MNLMIAGLVDVKEIDISGKIKITASKPTYCVGVSAPLKVKSNMDIWTVMSNDYSDDQDIIDESDLLTQDEVRSKPTLPVCGPKSKGKKACKNCSCGYADELDMAIVSDKITVKSACGSCYKGDAFRCASCPYRGMPAFKPGDKVELTMDNDV